MLLPAPLPVLTQVRQPGCPFPSTLNFWLLRMCSDHGVHEKCRTPGPVPDLENQILHFNTPHPGDWYAQ